MIITQFEARIKRVDSTDVDTPVQVTLSYDAGTDPFAVQAIFEIEGQEDRVWLFSRELLQFGARSLTPYGKGDVKFRYFPLDGAVLMCLRTDGQGPDEVSHADVVLPQSGVLQFLEDSAEAAKVTEQECGALVDDFLNELFEA